MIHNTVGVVISILGCALSVFAALQGFRIRLTVDSAQLVIVNRWRIYTVHLSDFVRFEPQMHWWGVITGHSGTLDVKALDRRQTVTTLATYGMSERAPEIAAIMKHIHGVQSGAGPD